MRGVYLLAAAAPFEIGVHIGYTTVTSSKILLIAVLAASIPSAHPLLRALRRSRVFFALCALVVCNAVTIVHARLPGETVRETFKQLEYLLIFAAGYCGFRADVERSGLRLVIEAVTLLVALCALLQEFTGAPSVFRGAHGLVPRIAGPLEGPNQLAAFFDVTITWIIAQIAHDEGRPHLRSLIVVAVAVLALFLTFSRGGIVAVLLTGAAAFAAVSRLRSTESCIFALAAAAGFGIDVMLARGAGHLLSLGDAGDTGSVGHRSQLWRAALFFWRTHPLFGIGTGNYAFRLGEAGYPQLCSHANSLYLQALAEGGLQLFTATVYSIAAIFKTLLRDIRRSPLALGACAATAALALHQSVDFLVFYPKIATLWWLLVGVAIAEHDERRISAR